MPTTLQTEIYVYQYVRISSVYVIIKLNAFFLISVLLAQDRDEMNKKLEKIEKMLQVLLDRSENRLPHGQSEQRKIEKLLPLRSKEGVCSFDELISEENFRKALVSILYMSI